MTEFAKRKYVYLAWRKQRLLLMATRPREAAAFTKSESVRSLPGNIRSSPRRGACASLSYARTETGEYQTGFSLATRECKEILFTDVIGPGSARGETRNRSGMEQHDSGFPGSSLTAQGALTLPTWKSSSSVDKSRSTEQPRKGAKNRKSSSSTLYPCAHISAEMCDIHSRATAQSPR